MRLLYILVLLTIYLPAQTLDTSLDTEKRTNKKFGWHTEGPGSYEFFFLGGKRYTGSFALRYESNSVKTQANFKKGSYHGVVINYNENGSIQSKGRYKNGYKIGKWIYYYDNVSYEIKYYSKREPNQVRKSMLISSNGLVKERYKALRNMRFSKYHYDYHPNGNVKLRKKLINRFKVIYEIEEFYQDTQVSKHYFLQYDSENEEWDYINEYKEFNKNGKLLVHEYH